MVNQKIEDFATCSLALAYIDELKKKGATGYLSNTATPFQVIDAQTKKKKTEYEYKWHVKYDASKLKVESKKDEQKKN